MSLLNNLSVHLIALKSCKTRHVFVVAHLMIAMTHVILSSVTIVSQGLPLGDIFQKYS